MRRTKIIAVLSLFSVSLLSAGFAAAQAPIEPAKLPARTIFYVVWRGMPAPDVRKANSLFALWDDPGLAPARSAFVESLVNDSRKDKSAPQLTRADWD